MALEYKNEFEKKQQSLHRADEAAKRGIDKVVRENIETIKKRNQIENARLHGCPDCTAAKCDDACPRYLTHYASRAEFWGWWGETSPPDRRAKDVLPPGPAKKSSGSRSRKKKKKKKTDRKYWIVD